VALLHLLLDDELRTLGRCLLAFVLLVLQILFKFNGFGLGCASGRLLQSNRETHYLLSDLFNQCLVFENRLRRVALVGNAAVGPHGHNELGERSSQSDVVRLFGTSNREETTRLMSAHHQDHGAALEKVALEALLRDPDRGVDVLFDASSGKRHAQWRRH
jgi:hypothetical protein